MVAMVGLRDVVAIVGVGCSRFGDRIDASLVDLFVEAYLEAIEDVDKGIDPREIDEAIIGSMSFSGEQVANLASLCIDYAGIPLIPAFKVENACGSGGYALRCGVLTILSGVADIVLVGGVEKMNDIPRERTRLWLGSGGDTTWERWCGLTFPGIFALQASRYIHEYGLSREQLAMVSVKNHEHGSMNPKAHFQFKVTIERVVGSPIVAYPLRLLDCCPTSDGAAVAILCRADIARKYTDTPIFIAGFGAAVDRLQITHRKDICTFPAAIKAAEAAYRMAKIGPEDIDLVELHDCFTIAEVVLTEDLGFCKKGEAGTLIEEEETKLGGRIPINVSGGLKAKGHPIGASGVGQIYEIVKQLKNEVKKRTRQIEGAEVGLAHIQGGFGVSAVVHILHRNG
jgi:acetyl-CoA C-acetyltransferase/acetyl-CoA acyltransferase